MQIIVVVTFYNKKKYKGLLNMRGYSHCYIIFNTVINKKIGFGTSVN